MKIQEHIFRAYDIRGKVPQDLNDQTLFLIGAAFGSDLTNQTVLIGWDGRLSSPAFTQAIEAGVKQAGAHPLLIGQVSTGTFYHCVTQVDDRQGHGLMITGSHNPPEDNGIKVIRDGLPLLPDQIDQLKQTVIELANSNELNLDSQLFADQTLTAIMDGQAQYLDWLTHHFSKKLTAPLPSLIIDAGNGVAGPIAQEIFSRFCEVDCLYCDVDGHFPNHHPDPSVQKNLLDLIQQVSSTTDGDTWGLAFDGDGDRLAVVTPTGQALNADEIMLCFIQDIIENNQNIKDQLLFLFDVKTSHRLHNMIHQLGAHFNTIRTGHSFLKFALKETKACFAGELSGHIAFQDPDTGFDCGIYAGLRWLELIHRRGKGFVWDVLAKWPKWHSTPELLVPIAEANKLAVIDKLKRSDVLSDYQQDHTDGIKFFKSDHWILVRPSNTTANLTVRVEAQSLQRLESALDAVSCELEKHLV